jgi:putative tryptophan/tyrosine transport system substrate-binding protein
MRRRDFIKVVASSATGAWSLAARAQQPAKVTRIGFLLAGTISGFAGHVATLRTGLRELGYVEGKNFVTEFRYAEGNYDRLPDLAAELVRRGVDIIICQGTPGTLAAKRATTTIPIVMAISGDAVATGLISSLAQPGGNVTGSTFFDPELSAKRLELTINAFPRISRVAVLLNADNPIDVANRNAMESAAKSLNIRLQQFEVRRLSELDSVFSAIAASRADAVAVTDDALFFTNAGTIAGLATQSRLPSAGFVEFAEAGGLIGYGVNILALWHRAAYFVDRILKGTMPHDLPVERPTEFKTVINLKTAKALGLTVPPTLLARADEVIE